MAKFLLNATVRVITQRDRIGTIATAPRTLAGEDWYGVRFGAGGLENLPERNLEVYVGPQDVESLLLSGSFGNRETLTRLITVTKTQRPLTNNVYSLRTTRTEFYPHQLKPVLKYLDSPNGRLLIADEVGLGKTIEAGLILVEERARQDLRRVLVVCPSALRQKWSSEMKRRFDEEFTILDSGGFREFLDRYESDPEETRLRGIISLQALRGESLIRELEARLPHFDLVVMDEAHHMRNPETYSYAAGRLLSDCADSLLLLTATPIHLGNQNLFYLLRLLDEEEFDELTAFQRRLAVNEHVLRAERLLRGLPVDLAAVRLALRRVEETQEAQRFFRNPLYGDALRRLDEYDGARRDHVIELQRAMSGLNVLSHVFTRTRKIDVHEQRATRVPHTLRLNFTARESGLYDAVTDFAADWYDNRRFGFSIREVMGASLSADSFAAIMLKRQAASCLPALVEQTLAAGAEDPTDADAEELGGDVGEVPDDGPEQARSIKKDPKFRALVEDYQDIEAQDSKYAALLGGIRELDRIETGQKLIVFSFFKGTLEYLHRRLTADGYSCVLVSGDVPSTPGRPESDERGRRFERFEKDPAIRILLSSEVGSEGLDLQFCHILVNYDLPWNPMVVEQRIGRVDRFGQKSDRVLVLNFSIPETIEDRILYRLYERIRIFEQSIGDLEPILGSEIQQLEREFLHSRLSDAEQEARIEQIANVLEMKRQEMKSLEAESERLIGQDEYFADELDRVRTLGRYVTAAELRLLVAEFLADAFPACSLSDGDEPNILLLRVNEELTRFVRRSSDEADSTLLSFLGKAYAGRLAVTFQSDVAYRRADVEFLTVHHPLVRAIAKRYRRERGGLHPVSRVEIATDIATEGHYVFLVYLLDVQGVRRRLQFESVFVAFDDLCELDGPTGEALLSAMSTTGDTLRDLPAVSLTHLRSLLDAAIETFGRRLTEFQADVQRTNAAVAANRSASLEGSYRVKIARQAKRLDTRREKPFQDRYVRMIEGTIRRLEAELRNKLAEIEENRRLDVRFELIAGGIVKVSRPS